MGGKWKGFGSDDNNFQTIKFYHSLNAGYKAWGKCVDDCLDKVMKSNGGTSCLYTTTCSNVGNKVVAFPIDSGYVGSRGILNYEPNGHFVLNELKAVGNGTWSFNVLDDFQLSMCESKEVNWPVDDCGDCTVPATLRLVGFKGKTALMELKKS